MSGERNECPDFYVIIGDDYRTKRCGIEVMKAEDDYFGKSNIHCYNGKKDVTLKIISLNASYPACFVIYCTYATELRNGTQDTHFFPQG